MNTVSSPSSKNCAFTACASPAAEPKELTNTAQISKTAIAAREVLTQANSYLHKLTTGTFIVTTPEISKTIVHICKIIDRSLLPLLKEKDDDVIDLAAKLREAQTTLFNKLPPIKVTTSDPEITIDVLARFVDKMLTIKTVIQDTGADVISLPMISRTNLSLVIAYLNGEQAITLENWYTFCMLALYLDIPELQKDCSSFAINTLSITHIGVLAISDTHLTQIMQMLPIDFVATLFTQYLQLDIKQKSIITTGWLKNIHHIRLISKNSVSALFELLTTTQLKECKSIEINETVTEEDLHRLAIAFPQIEKLNISFCKNITTVPTAFVRLKVLDASFSGLTQGGLNSFAPTASSIQELYIGNCSDITSIPTTCTKLEVLYASNSGLKQLGLDNLGKTAPHIKKLYISGQNEITSLPTVFTELRVLIASSSGLKQATIDTLTTTALHLEELIICNCNDIRSIAPARTKLKVLGVSSTNIKQEQLDILQKTAPALEKLYIAHCKDITNIPMFRKLNVLDASDANLSQKALNALSETAPGLKELYISFCIDITSIPAPFTRLKVLIALSSGLTRKERNALTSRASSFELLQVTD